MSTAQRYNLAYNYVFDKQPPFKKNVLINGSDSKTDERYMKEFTKAVCRLAESDSEIPAVKCNYVVPQTTGVNN
ncbi:hypothetical protein CMI37_02075 [Candidatus Pacearchaeota archaeon]|nr:hypothetical protein [Candidatus Pacearchaeota archaeon]|tara:strand:+ start:1406 stop:1627 length:222 start_codon:yes stop_codon:yes gene_type:complete